MWLATNVSVKPFPWFHHSCIASITSCLLCSSACSAGKLLLWRPPMLHLTVPCQDPLARAQRVQFGNGRAPSVPSSSCLWQRGLWGQHCPAEHRESLQQLPCCHLIGREGQQPMETRSQCSHGPDPSPCVRNSHGPSSPGSSSTATQAGELTATGKERTLTPQKWGSMEFIAQSTL